MSRNARTTAAARIRRVAPAGLAGALIAACFVGSTTGAGPALASGGRGDGPRFHCDNGLCIVPLAATTDSDADGVSDADEKAAGTDPHDPASRPPVVKLLDLASRRALPSFTTFASEFVVLPAVAPDGRSLQTAPAWPARDDALTRLGITGELLGKAGLDGGGQAIRVAADPLRLGGKRIATPSGLPVRVGGMAVGLISAGDGVTSTKEIDYHRNGNVTTTTTDVTKQGGYTETRIEAVTKDANGTTVNWNLQVVKETENPDGSASTTVEQCSKAGCSTPVTNTTPPTTGPGTPNTPSTAPSTPSSSAPSTPSSSAAASTTQTTTASEDDDELAPLPNLGTYVNPDADDGSVLYLSEADIARVLGKGGWNTTPGPTQATPTVDPSGVVIVPGGVDPTIAYIDDTANGADTPVFGKPAIKGTEPRPMHPDFGPVGPNPSCPTFPSC
jgi:hypothetical protein